MGRIQCKMDSCRNETTLAYVTNEHLCWFISVNLAQTGNIWEDKNLRIATITLAYRQFYGTLSWLIIDEGGTSSL